MKKSELVAKIAESAGLTKVQAEASVNAFVDVVTAALVDGDKVSLKGFGNFEVSHREARMGRVPRTGETIEIPARDVPVFKVSSTLKKAVNKE
jgi:Bacterial nucleoid DNA-binding protein